MFFISCVFINKLSYFFVWVSLNSWSIFDLKKYMYMRRILLLEFNFVKIIFNDVYRIYFMI